jgi:hypothetical protein
MTFTVLSLCTSAGLWDKAHIQAGHKVIPACELMPHKRHLYQQFAQDTPFVTDDLAKVRAWIDRTPELKVDLIIGGIPCQSRSKTRAMRPPKFPDLLPVLLDLLAHPALQGVPYLFENVSPLEIPGAFTVKLDAMNFVPLGDPAQSRPRWFTHSMFGIKEPRQITPGTVDTLMAYPAVAARLYGPKRGAVLQGWPEFASMKAPCAQLQEALADGVPKCLADAWIDANDWRFSCPDGRP